MMGCFGLCQQGNAGSIAALDPQSFAVETRSTDARKGWYCGSWRHVDPGWSGRLMSESLAERMRVARKGGDEAQVACLAHRT